MMLAFSGHKMSRPNRLTGVFFEYNRGAVIDFPAMTIGIG